MKVKRKKGKPQKGQPKAYVLVKCTMCDNKRKVYADEVGMNEMPECEKCCSMMVVEKSGV